jgi:hypothetical protein
MKSFFFKQWPLAPNLQEWRITRANVSRRVTFLSKMDFGKCGRVWRVPKMATFWRMRVWQVFKIKPGGLDWSRRDLDRDLDLDAKKVSVST